MSFGKILSKRIHYQLINEQLLQEGKPLMVFLHEGLGSINQWKNYPNKLAYSLNLPALVYDRYGYGKSERFCEPRSIDYIENEAIYYLPALLKELKIDNQLILFGHSDGGSIALIYAGLNNNVLAVIAEAAHVVIEEVSREGIRKAKQAFENANLKELLAKYHRENTELMFYGWANTWLSEESKDWDICHYLEEITCPVLLIQGKDDEYGTKIQLDLIAKSIPGQTQIKHLDNCGHTPHFQSNEEVNDINKSFLATIIS